MDGWYNKFQQINYNKFQQINNKFQQINNLIIKILGVVHYNKFQQINNLIIRGYSDEDLWLWARFDIWGPKF